MKNCLGECSLKVTRPDDECSKILVSNPGRSFPFTGVASLYLINKQHLCSGRLDAFHNLFEKVSLKVVIILKA